MRTSHLLPLVFLLTFTTVISVRTGSGEIPHYTRPPRTSFTCKGRSNGYYADHEAHCAAYHVCDNGRKHSFVCPVTTLFNEQVMTCDYHYNVNCDGNNEKSPRKDDDQAPQARTIDAYPDRVNYNNNHQEEVETSTAESHHHPRRDSKVCSENKIPEGSSTAESHHHHHDHRDQNDYKGCPNNIQVNSPYESTTLDWQSQYSTTKPAVMWIKASTEAPTTLTYATTESATTKASIRKPVKSPRNKIITKSTTTTESPSSQSSTARANEDESSMQVRNENWLKELPKITTENIFNTEITTLPTLTSEAIELVGEKRQVKIIEKEKDVNKELKTEQPYVSRYPRKPSNSNSLIGTMMKWASTNIKQQYDSNNSNKLNNRSSTNENGEKMRSPFELEQELSSVKPLVEPVTEVSPYEFPIGPSNEIEDKSKPERPIYFPPSVQVDLGRGRSIYVAESKRSQISVPSSSKREEESLDHPSPWLFPMRDENVQSDGKTVNSPGDREDVTVPSKSKSRSKVGVGVVREGRCVCTEPTE